VTVLAIIGELGRGGTEQQLRLVMKHMDAAQCERHVMVFNSSRLLVHDDDLEAHGVRVWRISDRHGSIPQRMLDLYRLLRRLRPQVVHSWTTHDNAYAGIVGALARVPVRLGSLRGALDSDGMRRLPRLLRSLSIRSVQGLVVNNEGLRESLMAVGVDRARIAVLPNCVESRPANEASVTADLTEVGIEPSHLVIGTVGNLRGVKNHGLLVEAMAQIASERRDVRCVIVGQDVAAEPHVRTGLERVIDQLGLRGTVVLLGFRDDARSVVRRCDIFCLTSASEGTPNALLEAMSEARAIVATRVGGVAELIEHRENGWLIEPGDREGLVQGLRDLLSDPAKREALGARARRRVKELDCRQMALRLADLYRDALEGRWPASSDNRNG